MLMLLQEPRVPEHLAALIAAEDEPVLLLPVLQVLSPGLSCEGAGLLFAGVPSVHLLMSLQLAWEGELHLAAFISALVRGQLGVLITHVGFKLLVLLKFEPTTLKSTSILLLLLSVNAAYVSGPVRVGGEGLRASVHGAVKGLHAAVSELMSCQVIRATERLPAAVVLTGVRLHSRVFTQMSVELPLFVISRRAVGKRADVTFVWLLFSFHFCGIEK